MSVSGPDPGYCVFQGAFFLYDDKSDRYVVTEPPGGHAGAVPPGRLY
jgi:hypothetical protein